MEKISKEIIASEHKGIIMTRLIQSFVHDPLLIISTEEIFLRHFLKIYFFDITYIVLHA